MSDRSSFTAAHATACAGAYRRVRHDLTQLALGLCPDLLRRVVPATPAWTVHDVLAHLTGLAVDLNAERFGDGDPDAWTDAQVRARRSHRMSEIVAEWEGAATQFEDGLTLLGPEIGAHFVGDLVQHSQDVRSTVGAPRIDDGDAIDLALEHYLHTAAATLDERGVGAIEVVRTDGREHRIGTGPVVAVLHVSAFELLRALGGRRSRTQLAAMSWKGDLTRVLPFVSAYPVPTVDLVDP